MPGTYQVRGCVLRRTKLSETDLIVTLLADTSTQVRAVAKGARKPSGRLCAVVDLANDVELLLNRGKNLDVIREGRLVKSRAELARDYGRLTMAQVVLDCTAELTCEAEHDPRLPALVRTALDALNEAPQERTALLAAACILKADAMQGFRPHLNSCVRCGKAIDEGANMSFDVDEGGAVCPQCSSVPSLQVNIAWLRCLMHMTFAELLSCSADSEDGMWDLGLELLGFCRTWLGHYPGIRPRALDFALNNVYRF